MSLSSQLSRLAFFSESNPTPQPSHFFPHRNLRGQSSGAEDLSTQRWVSLRWLYPRIPHSRPTESFHLFSALARTSIPLQLWAIWSHSVEAMTRDGRQPVIGSFRCRGAVGLVPRSCPLVSSPGMDADLFRILSNAVEEGLEWSPTEEPFRSHLDEWFLPERGRAPRQQSSPFFPEVHDEITKSWHAPYSSRLRASSSSALTSVEGTEEKGYDSLTPLDESVAAHLYPPTATGRKAKAAHPSKLCRMTSALAGRAYSSAGQAASALHSKVVLQVLQAKLLCSMDESNPNPAAFNELCSATDLALRHQDDSSGDRQIHGQFSGARALSVVEPDRDEGCG